MAERRPKQDEDAQSADKAAREAVQNQPASSDEEFPVERVIEEGDALVGYPPHVVAGALASTQRKNVTQAQAKAAVEAWLESPLKED